MKFIIFFVVTFFINISISYSSSDFQSTSNFDIKFKFSVPNFGIDLNSFDWQKSFESRRGGSFGRSRGTRTRSSTRSGTQTAPINRQKQPSFGGQRMTSQTAQAKYGAPRRTESMRTSNAAGGQTDYRVNHYGGFSSSLMTGYMMGNMAWWMTAPAFFYTRPNYVENEDGTVDVYPPSFSFGKLFTFLIVIYVIVYFIRFMRTASRQAREQEPQSYSSFG
ncbi:MAG: hypothetical protein CVV22_08210 [Ignavibacteriae bacterium HGW-Ignavibacteriae-1]|jgi:hypothetical protein|nr:MAG: hypothetical protein CVV22_08210 [Ignavibacteriae bacterium HGW-Ignavibacteriae-1]